MALVDYSSSSSSSSDNEEIPEPKRRKENHVNGKLDKLPLPEAIRKLARKSDDNPVSNPSEHGGRIRTFGHERGNWASFVYIPVNLPILEDIQKFIKEILPEEINLQENTEFHISLSKTVILRHHWIDSFVKSIKSELAFENRFDLEILTVKVYCNENRTRTFVALKIKDSYFKLLIKFMEKIDSIMTEFRLEKFYEDPSFHTSILWCTGDKEQQINEQVLQIQNKIDETYRNSPNEFIFNVKTMCCKTGNKIFNFNLVSEALNPK